MHLSKLIPGHKIVEFNQGPPKVWSRLDATELIPYIEREEDRVRQKRDVIKQAIQQQSEELRKEVTALCTAKLREVDTAAEQLLEKVSAMKFVSQVDKLRALKVCNSPLASFECTFSKVKLSDYVKVTSEFLVSFADPIQVQLATVRPNQWWSCTSGVEALTVSFSRPMKLCAVSIGKQQPGRPPVTLESLQVVEGRSTQGKVLYVHQRVCPVNSELPDRVEIQLRSSVPMKAGACYTIKAELRGGQVMCTGRVARMVTERDVQLSIDPAEFSGSDISGGSDTESGIFFSLSYQV